MMPQDGTSLFFPWTSEKPASFKLDLVKQQKVLPNRKTSGCI